MNAARRFVCPTCGSTAAEQGACARDRSPLTDAHDDPLLGTEVGGYRLTRVIGHGGMGTVYRAVEAAIDAEVAIKVLGAELAEERESVERFIAEAKTANLVRHEGLVKVLALGVLRDGRPYQVMEHLTGLPMSAAIRGPGSLPIGTLCTRLAETLRAIGAVHARGIIHRDLKPSNLFVTTAGFIKVLDFGIAKLASGRTGLTRTGHAIGTPGYMSPEQAEATAVDARSDIYSMGVVLYECIAGVRPFEGRVVEAMARREPPPALPAAPPHVEAIVREAMAFEPRDRFGDALAMARALELAAAELPQDVFGPLIVAGESVAVPVARPAPADPASDVVDSETVRIGGIAPARLGRYLVEGTVGSGGEGRVMRGVDPAVQREVALKLVRAGGPERRARVLAEARAMARVNHPNVVTLFELGEDGDQMFLAMEYLDAVDLERWLAAASRPWRAILAKFIEAGRGLAAAHAAGVVHRDFKPANVLLARDGRAKVGDFGIARTDGATGAPQGTIAYMAPEQLEGGTVDPRADQFAFSAALWHALHGELPYADAGDAALAAALAAHRSELRAPRNRHVPQAITAALRRGLEPDPEARFPNMTELLEALTARRQRWSIAVVATVVIASVVATILTIAKHAPEPPTLTLDQIAALPSASDRLRALAALPEPQRTSERARALAGEAALDGYVRTFELPAAPIVLPDDLAVSATGRVVAVATHNGVWIQRLDDGTSRMLPRPGEVSALAIDDATGVVRAAIGEGIVEAPLAGGAWTAASHCKLRTPGVYSHDRLLHHVACDEVEGGWVQTVGSAQRLPLDMSGPTSFGPSGNRVYALHYDRASVATFDLDGAHTEQRHELPEGAQLVFGDDLVAIIAGHDVSVWEPATDRVATWHGTAADTFVSPTLIEGPHPRLALMRPGGLVLVLDIDRTDKLAFLAQSIIASPTPQRVEAGGGRLLALYPDHVVVEDRDRLTSWMLLGAPGLVATDATGDRVVLLDDRTLRVWDPALREPAVLAGREIRLSDVSEHWAVVRDDDRLRWYDTYHPDKVVAETKVTDKATMLFSHVPGTAYFIDRGATMSWRAGEAPRLASTNTSIQRFYRVDDAVFGVTRDHTLVALADDRRQCDGGSVLAVGTDRAVVELAGGRVAICNLGTHALVPFADPPPGTSRWTFTIGGDLVTALYGEHARLYDATTAAAIPNEALERLTTPDLVEGTRDRLFVASRDGLHVIDHGQLRQLFGPQAMRTTTYGGGREAFVVSEGTVLAIDLDTGARRPAARIGVDLGRLPAIWRLGQSLILYNFIGADLAAMVVWQIEPPSTEQTERWFARVRAMNTSVR